MTAVVLREVAAGAGPICRGILAALPRWFGIPESVDEYVEAADRTPTIVATVGERDAGVLVPLRHTEWAAEIVVMAVLPDLHRRGVGRAMLAHAEATLAAAGVEYLQVKTLADTHPDEGYARTRQFYLACGFRPLEVFPTLWHPGNPALQLVKRLWGPSGAAGEAVVTRS
jgi:GNAT superfamily N-acetyltransferase